jgi:hypothetical protein
MIVEHKDTGQLYRVLMKSFDVKTHKPHVVYMQLETGAIFNRDTEAFNNKFRVRVEDPQEHIAPKKGWEHGDE